jgi:TRAP transporter TAXI family solute receptor
MRGSRTALAALAAIALVVPATAQEAAPAQAEAPELVSMGTGAITGVYFPVGVALCRLVNQHRRETNLRCAARLSAGSVANVAALREGGVGLAIVQSDIQADALAGTGPFVEAGPFPDLTAVMALYPEPLTLVARADSGIARVEDLAGKRVWIGPEGSGTRALAEALMGALGWSAASFAPVPEISPDLVAGALCDGEIDAFFYAVGHPALVIQEATTACDGVLVAVAGPAVAEMVDATPAFVAATIPGGLYRGNRQPVASFGVGATLVTRADQPEERVHTMVGEIFADIEMLRGLEPVLSRLDPREMVSEGLSAPLHRGAARFYREQGWID